jgi:hypothetical protein
LRLLSWYDTLHQMDHASEACVVRHDAAAQAETRRSVAMTEPMPLVTILCVQCSRRAQVRRGDPLPAGWVEHVGMLSCSETCRELLQSMGLLPDE